MLTGFMANERDAPMYRKPVLFLFLLCSSVNAFAAKNQVPGVIITHIPATEERYIGSPSIAILPDGNYVVSHDEFGPRSTEKTSAVTHLFRSTDQGNTWTKLTSIDGAFWATLFVHHNALYLLGTAKSNGNIVLRRSDDGGATWTTPQNASTGILAEGRYHCAPVPVVVHNGRVWRAMENTDGPKGWGRCFRAFMMSAPADADLLNAGNWTFSNALGYDSTWLKGRFGGWLEGNAVVTPSGEMVDMLRVEAPTRKEYAAMIRISPDGQQATFDPRHGFVPFPGGAKKFTIRWDAPSQRYWSLTNYVPWYFAQHKPASTRNTLSLVSSKDLTHWKVERTILQHPDREKHGFQYVDWLFDGDDLIAACRTAYDAKGEEAHNFHDANYLTFHRIKHFRH